MSTKTLGDLTPRDIGRKVTIQSAHAVGEWSASLPLGVSVEVER